MQPIGTQMIPRGSPVLFVDPSSLRAGLALMTGPTPDEVVWCAAVTTTTAGEVLERSELVAGTILTIAKKLQPVHAVIELPCQQHQPQRFEQLRRRHRVSEYSHRAPAGLRLHGRAGSTGES